MTTNNIVHVSLHAAPGLLNLYGRALTRLSPAAREQVENHVTMADRVIGEVFDGIETFTLRTHGGIWVRAADLAVILGVDRTAVSHAVTEAIGRGDLAEGRDIIRDIRRDDIVSDAISEESSTVRNGRGVMVVSLSGARRLAALGRGERGVKFRNAIERVFDAQGEAERMLLALTLDVMESAPVAPPIDPIKAARLLLRAGDKSGASDVLRTALGMPVLEEPEVALGRLTERDPWTLAVEEYTSTRQVLRISDLIADLGLERNKTTEMRVGRLLRGLGWKRGTDRRRLWRWR